MWGNASYTFVFGITYTEYVAESLKMGAMALKGSIRPFHKKDFTNVYIQNEERDPEMRQKSPKVGC